MTLSQKFDALIDALISERDPYTIDAVAEATKLDPQAIVKDDEQWVEITFSDGSNVSLFFGEELP